MTHPYYWVLVGVALLCFVVGWFFPYKPAVIPLAESGEKEFVMLLKSIEVLPGQFVRLTNPVTKEIIKVFGEGEKIVEKEWGLIEGTIEAGHSAAVKVTTLVPTVESGTSVPGVPVTQAPAVATTPGTAS